MIVFDLRAVEGTESGNPTVDPADIRGLVTISLASVGCLPQSRHGDACRSLHAAEGATTQGLRLFQDISETSRLNHFAVMGAIT
jgi:hypothetical protein